MTSEPVGILPGQQLRQLLDRGQIAPTTEIDRDQLQPNSLDLRVGDVAYRARCSFLAVGTTVEALLSEVMLDRIALTGDGGVLETGKVYVIPLRERLDLPPELFGAANPKSSTGRLDILARVLIDHGSMFDAIPAGYRGPLFVEVVPRAFPIRLRSGDRLSQLRVAHRDAAQLSDAELRREIAEHSLVRSHYGRPIDPDELAIDDGVFLTVNVTGRPDETIGYQARKSTPLVDLRRTDHRRRHYWHYIGASTRGGEHLILQPDEFYIFSSRQRVVVPPHLCAEMVPYDAKSGELRTHYAGFFDSGFGHAPGGSRGARVVLEVRNLDVPFMLQDGQRLFRLRYFRNRAQPDVLYGDALASNYQGQGLRLSKHFRGREREPVDRRQMDLW